MSERRRFRDGGEWESAYGYCRAIRTDDLILVSGCTSAVDGAVRHPADPAAQTRVAIDTALAAVTALGGAVGDVVRTRIYLTHRRDCDAVGQVHAEVFGENPPVSTMVVVVGLLHPDMRVEIEVEAVVAARAQDDDVVADPSQGDDVAADPSQGGDVVEDP